MYGIAVSLGLVGAFVGKALCQTPLEYPDNGTESTAPGGIYGFETWTALRTYFSSSPNYFTFGPESPKDPKPNEKTGGSGPYPAGIFRDTALPRHTIYAPDTLRKGLKLPVILWGNSLCVAQGTLFQAFLTEIASWGYIVIANGGNGPPPIPTRAPPATPTSCTCKATPTTTTSTSSAKGPGPTPNVLIAQWQYALNLLNSSLTGLVYDGQTSPKMMADSISWVDAGGSYNRFGEVDKDNIVVAGHDCGGLEAYSAAYRDERIKSIVLFNSGLVDRTKDYLLTEFYAPLLYVYGGFWDFSWNSTEADYYSLLPGLRAVKASLPTGHLGTFYDHNGGKYAKLMVSYMNWITKGDNRARSLFLNPDSQLVKDGWSITSKNWNEWIQHAK
ncbi:hypothetical protein BT63DRAFT_460147 [Microthyrium microscopicum]|uniref:Alpha/beta-hydrolase n=1 Tax=Microthyrium microscopicum TaxID=703497 RepID=A0A6A6TX30_9PEZI|nr:hypothetical protein BT63DRAFT_460147 [Microthyrium microscopicum]